MGHYIVRYDPPLARRIARHFAELPVHEAVALVNDQALLAESGLVTFASALRWAETGLRHASPVVRLAAVNALRKIRDDGLDAKALGLKRAIVQRRVQPLAKEVGWEHRPGEPDEARLLRETLLPFAAERPGGAPLRAKARELALAWLRDRGAIDAGMVTPVLDTAGRFADAATYELLEREAIGAAQVRDRRALQSALAKVRDPALRPRALALAERLPPGRDAQLFVEDALLDEANRRAAFAYVRASFDALVAKLPQHAPGRFATQLNGLCTHGDRDAFVAFFKDRAPKFQGGQRRYEQALEAIDLCVSARSASGRRPAR